MSQKNGHALESVTLTAMLRRWTSSLLLIAVAAAGALSAMILQNLTIRQENALCNTIENTTISCTVTNAKGTDSGNLQMLSAFVEMLEGKSENVIGETGRRNTQQDSLDRFRSRSFSSRRGLCPIF